MTRYLKLLVVLSLFVVFPQKIHAQLSTHISRNEYYDFFNSFTKPDSVRQFNLESRSDFNYILSDSASIFADTALLSPEDVRFMKFQIGIAWSFKWRSSKMLGAKIISSKSIKKIFAKDVIEGWTTFIKKYKYGFMTYSVPLFTVDRNICLVYIAWHCGNLCGHGDTRVYKKINGKWTFVKSTGMMWVS